ncbi:MAG: hypothetical protein EBS52_05845 [Betaproteobacteria bacterium]|nr:hypothetical protein [Betaproteobacteria bacterium]
MGPWSCDFYDRLIGMVANQQIGKARRHRIGSAATRQGPMRPIRSPLILDGAQKAGFSDAKPRSGLDRLGQR